jgi:hypothetical protein
MYEYDGNVEKNTMSNVGDGFGRLCRRHHGLAHRNQVHLTLPSSVSSALSDYRGNNGLVGI